eukprot:SAG31_NODE_796_length_12032_cov_21.073242_7_plen_62_part_00
MHLHSKSRDVLNREAQIFKVDVTLTHIRIHDGTPKIVVNFAHIGERRLQKVYGLQKQGPTL